jgi:signal transduction histidine kinase/CheY-like chemotaxis protein
LFFKSTKIRQNLGALINYQLSICLAPLKKPATNNFNNFYLGDAGVLQKLFNQLQRLVFSEEIRLEIRLLNLLGGVGVIACLAFAGGSLVAGLSSKVFGVIGAITVLITLGLIVANRIAYYQMVAWITLFLICNVLFPVLFFLSGGIDSGMSASFLLSMILIFLLLPGQACLIMVAIHIAVVSGCYYFNYNHPELVIPLGSEFQRYVDNFQNFIIGGLFIGLVVKFQTVLYAREKSKAEAAEQAKSDFLSNISHEIRGPLNAIIGLGNMELKKDLPEESRDHMEQICQSSNLLLNIVNDILDMSRIESDRFELVTEEYSLPSLIHDVANLNLLHKGNKKIDFRLELDDNLPSRIYGDELRIKQILSNLLSNAFKYTLAGSVVLRVDSQPLSGDNVQLRFRVSDTGIGIKPQDMDKLFVKYGRLHSSSHHNIEGTGLGLAICKSMVDLMRGNISAVSEYGAGSTFTVSFRQQLAGRERIGRDMVQNLTNWRFRDDYGDNSRTVVPLPMPYARVLVVDDMPVNLEVARGFLNLYEIEADLVSDGQEAINRVRKHAVHYDAIFMDHMMLDLDGMETVRIIRSDIGSDYARTVPIIAMTANALPGYEEMFLANGFQAFLSKPIDQFNLDEILRRFVRDERREAAVLRRAKPEPAPEPKAEPAPPPADLTGELWEIKIPGVDLATGMSHFQPHPATYFKVLNSFVQSIPQHIEHLQNLLAGGYLAEYAVVVHGIKSSCYGIFAQDLGQTADALERAARAEDVRAVVQGHQRLLAEMETVLPALEVLVQKGRQSLQPDRPKEMNLEPDMKLLRDLLWASRDYDLEAMERIMTELERFSYAARGELIVELRQYLDNFNYEQIQKNLNIFLSGS